MPRAEALSYLTLGKGLDELNSGEQASLNQAANALALSGGGLLARWSLATLERQGRIERAGDRLALTDSGRESARQATEEHGNAECS